MGRLIYSANVSLDGYANDADGSFSWSQPDEQVHAYIADLVRPMGTHLYGRRMYEVMSFWETVDDPDPFMVDFAQLWQAAEKVVYSRTLTETSTARTRIESDFDGETVRALVEASDTDVLIGGAELAGQALAAGLVDEIHTFAHPILIGSGSRWLPDAVRVDLELVDQHRFGGVVHLHHRVLR
jgi:dihydrofolate reductase